MPCSRAMFVGDAPGARLCAAIVCFCSVVQRRRRSPRGIKSTRRVGAFLRLVVCALSVDAAVSAGVAFVSIAHLRQDLGDSAGFRLIWHEELAESLGILEWQDM